MGAVLAAVSSPFHQCLNGLAMEPGKPIVLKLDDISEPDAVQAMIDGIYGTSGGAAVDYNPVSEAVNADVLRLAQRFQIGELEARAARWLAQKLTTANVLGRLVACEEFGLIHVRDNILEQLIANPDALFVLTKDPEITKVPAVLQDLLIRILKLLGCDGSAIQKHDKKRKAGA